MIVNLSESLQPLASILICVIIASHLLLRTFPTLKKETFHPSIRRMGRSIETGTINNTSVKTAMTVKLTCKVCNVTMDRLTWMSNRSCENPNCKCPEVQKLRRQAQEVINKARGPVNIQSVKRNTVPTGYDEAVDQYMVDIPDVMVVDIIVPKNGGGQKRRK